MKQAKAEAVQQEFQQFNDLATLLKERTGADFTENPVMYETLFDLFKSQVRLYYIMEIISLPFIASASAVLPCL